MLHSILIAFKNLLRPSDLTSHDKGPAENLASKIFEDFFNGSMNLKRFFLKIISGLG